MGTLVAQLLGPNGRVKFRENYDWTHEPVEIRLADEQPVAVPVERGHDTGMTVGSVVHLERSRHGSVWAVAVVESRPTETYASIGATYRRSGPNEVTARDVVLEHVALVHATAMLGVAPVNYFDDDVRTFRSFRIPTATDRYVKGLLARAGSRYDRPDCLRARETTLRIVDEPRASRPTDPVPSGERQHERRRAVPTLYDASDRATRTTPGGLPILVRPCSGYITHVDGIEVGP